MALSIIKFFIVSFCSFYSFPKLMNIKFTKRTALLALPFSIISAVGGTIFKTHLSPLTYIFMVLLISLFNWIIHKGSLNTTAVFSVISFVLSYFLSLLSAFAIIPIIFTVFAFAGNSELVDIVLYILADVVTFLLTVLLFHVKRFKNGLTFLEEKISTDLGLFISAMGLMAFSFTTIENNTDMVMTILIFVILLCGIMLLIWWQKHIKDIYVKKVHTRNIESLGQTIQELKKENDYLRYHNEELSKIIHKDNKLIPAMNMTVRSLLVNVRDEAVSEAKKSKIENLLKSLDALSEERRGIVTKYEKNNNVEIHPTGFISIDAILLYMRNKAQDLSIDFDYTISYDISEIINEVIDEANLNTLLADLIENALIAVSFCETSIKSVKVIFRKAESHFQIDIYDSGIPFEPKTISNFGKKRATTHADTGGSGIGLMTTYEIIKKFHASFIIDENMDSDIFTKCVSVSFDNLSEIHIKSIRAGIIKACKQRNDVILES